MRHQIWIYAAAVAAGVASFSSCMKESEIDEKYRPAGTEIIFSAESTYKNNEETRTEFTNTDLGVSGYTNKFERINWVSGDRMSISYQRTGITTQTGTYGVTSTPEAAIEMSNAGVDFMGTGTKLTWEGGSGDHLFFAMYPDNSSGTNSMFAVSGGATVTGTLPSAQSVTYNATQKKYLPADMKLCYMVGYKKLAGTSTDSRVTIPFTPAVTMFEFILKRKDIGTTYVKSVKLEAANLTGTFSFKLTGGNNVKGEDWWNRSTSSGTDRTTLSGVSNTISVTFPSPATMTKDDALNFTVLALPVEISNIKLTLEMSTDGTNYFEKHLDLNHTFKAAKKHIITNSNVPDESWTYTLVHTGTTFNITGGYTTDGFTITDAQGVTRNAKTAGITNTVPFESYYTKQGDPTKYPVDVTYQFATGTSEKPTGTWSSTTKPTGADNVTIGGSSSQFARTLAASVTAYNPPSSATTTKDLSALRTEHLRSLPAVGSSSDPRDLSLYEVSNAGITERASKKPTTANCYIVDRPGWYMFPIVYGNSIDYSHAANGLNANAYTDGSGLTNTQYLWHTLQKFDGGLIQSPYILDDASLTYNDVEAVYVWEDVAAGNAFLTNLAVEQKTVGNFPNKSKVDYVKFEVPSSTICQGNAVVAVRKKSDKTILWSWHIWVTDGYDADQDGQGDGFGTIKVVTRSSSVKSDNDFFPMSLGWCDAGTAQVYENRYWWVKVIQKDVSNAHIMNEIIFRVTQQAPPQSTEALSSGTFYQWGRKDPFLPSLPGSGTTSAFKPHHSQDNYYEVTTDANTVNFTQTVGENAALSIQNPYIFYLRRVESGYQMWMKNQYPANLWNINGRIDADIAIVKTVYDPCPPGFCLPHKQAFTYFTTTGGRTNTFSQFNVVDKDGGGIGTSDYDSGISPGWIYYTGVGDETIHFPAVGWIDQRLGDPAGLVNVDSLWGRYTDYWTGAAAGNSHHSYTCAYRLHADHLTIGPSDADAWSSGFAVRPVKED